MVKKKDVDVAALTAENAQLKAQLKVAESKVTPPKKRVPKDVSLVDQVASLTTGGKGETIDAAGKTTEDKVGPQEVAVGKLMAILRQAEASKVGGGKRAKARKANLLAQCDAALRLIRYNGVPAVAAATQVGIDLDKAPKPEPAVPVPAEAATEVPTPEVE